MKFTFLLIFLFTIQVSCAPQECGTLQRPTVQDETKLENSANEIEDICLTKGCVTAAAAVIKYINQSADPCEDFYEFSCGNFIKNEPIPDDKTRVISFSLIQEDLTKKLRSVVQEPIKSSDSEPVRMVKNMFSSCMNKDLRENEGLIPLQKIHARMGEWPVTDPSWDQSTFDWLESMKINRREGFSNNYFFSFSVSTNFRNSTEWMLRIDQASLGISREYLMNGLDDKDIKAYLQYSIDVAILMGAQNHTAHRDMLDVLNFQIELAKISTPREERRNVTILFNPYSLKNLSSIVPEIPFVPLINSLMVPEVSVNESEIISVANITYLSNLTALINNTPKRTLANYVLWRVAQASATYLSEDIRELQLKYQAERFGKNRREPRWEECLKSHVSRLQYAVSNIYVNNFFDNSAKQQAVELVDYIMAEFEIILNTIDWMDPITKKNALKKASTMKTLIAFPPEIIQVPKLMEYYNGLVINNGSIAENILRFSKFSTDYSFKRLREPIDKDDWKNQGNVAIVNAFYSWIVNSINFPAGILQGIFFEPDRPKYMNFGAIGFIIGHEITHGFDDQGRQFNSNGDLENWWEVETEERFLEKAKCVINQYGNYVAPENGMNLNGINTQGENIADNGGLKESYLAYQKWVNDHGKEQLLPGLMEYNQNQIFWLSAAQIWCSNIRPETLKSNILTGVHSPGRFRVIGPFSNSPEFSRDFNCPIGSPMNPSHKCSVW